METALRVFDAVHLYTYTVGLRNVPEGVKVMRAERLLPKELFLSYLATGSERQDGFIAPLADFVRFLAIEATDAEASWFVDVDTHWLKPLLDLVSRAMHGHLWGTFELNIRSFENLDWLKRQAKLTVEHCAHPRDYLHIATPLRFPRHSPVLRCILTRLRAIFAPDGTLNDFGGYDTVMDIVASSINDCGLRRGYQRPETFCPVPFFAWQKPLQKASKNNPEWGLRALLAKDCFAVNAFWQSSKDDKTRANQDSASCVEKGSMWSDLRTYLASQRGPPRSLKRPASPARSQSPGLPGGSPFVLRRNRLPGGSPAGGSTAVASPAAVAQERLWPRLLEPDSVVSGIFPFLGRVDQRAFAPVVGFARTPQGVLGDLQWERGIKMTMWSKDIGAKLRKMGLRTSQMVELVAKAYFVLEGQREQPPIARFRVGTLTLALLLTALDLTTLSTDLLEVARTRLIAQMSAEEKTDAIFAQARWVARWASTALPSIDVS